jgi:phage gp46-like protein
MPDIAVIFNNDTGLADWLLQNGDVALTNSDLLSSVMLQLFTDRRCSDDFIPSDGDPRGWWGSYFEPFEIGSRLWQLDRAYFSGKDNILLQARDHTREALQPFIDQGIAAKINIDVQKLSINAIGISIQMYKPATTTAFFTYSFVWNQLGL